MSSYEKDRAELLEVLRRFRDTYAAGFDVGQATKRLIAEIENEEAGAG